MSLFRRLALPALIAPVSLVAAEFVLPDLPTGEALLKQDGNGGIHVAFLGNEGTLHRVDEAGDPAVSGPSLLTPLRSYDLAPDGGVWAVANGEVSRSPLDPGDDVVIRTRSFQPHSDPGRLFVSRSGDVWLSDARAMRRNDGLFHPTGFVEGAENLLEPRCEDSFGNIWAARVDRRGRGVGLAVRTFADPFKWRELPLPEGIAGEWKGLCADDVGHVWLATTAEAVQINPKMADGGFRRFESPVEARISSIARVANRQIVVGFSDGTVRELKTTPETDAEWELKERSRLGPVRAMLHARDGRLWVISGDKLLRSDALREPWHGRWIEQSPMPAGNHDNIFARIGDKLYTAGGKTFFGWPAAEWVNLDHVWSYDTRDGTWAVEPPMLEPGKAYSGIAALEDELWLIGGHFRVERGLKATATVEIYDPETRRYRRGAEYPAARAQVVALTVGDRIYAVGGGAGKASSSEMFSIGTEEKEWRPEPPAPSPLTQAAGCVVAGKIHIASGARSNCPGLFVYDPESRKWSSVKHPLEPAPAAPLVAALDDTIWVMGGRGETGGLTATYAYSVSAEQWTRGPDLPVPVSWGAAEAVNGKILIAGGAYHDPQVGGSRVYNSDRVFFLKRK